MEDERSRVSCVIAMVLMAVALLLPLAIFVIAILAFQPSWGPAT